MGVGVRAKMRRSSGESLFSGCQADDFAQRKAPARNAAGPHRAADVATRMRMRRRILCLALIYLGRTGGRIGASECQWARRRLRESEWIEYATHGGLRKQ